MNQQRRRQVTRPTQATRTDGFASNGQSNQELAAQVESSPENEGYLDLQEGGPARRGEPDTWVQSSTTAPPEGTVVADLDAGELPTNATQWVKLTTDTTRWIDLGSLSPEDREQVLRRLGTTGGYAEAAGDNLEIGTTDVERSLDGGTHSARDVLTKANEEGLGQDTPHWDYLNGGSTALTRDECTEEERATWKAGQKKPGAWYNGYEIVDGEVQVRGSRFDQRDAPDVDLEALQGVISRTLDTNGIKAAFGDDEGAFVAAMREKMGEDHPLGEAGSAAVLAELWSYLQTGADADGKTDIGRLQALTKAVSGDTEATADSNTPFEGETFEVAPGVELQMGDGVFGRASMLSLMHLFGQAEESEIPPMELGFVDAQLFGEGDRFVNDSSGSISGNWHDVREAVDESQGWKDGEDGVRERTVGSFTGTKSLIGAPDEMKQSIQVAESLTRAFDSLYDESTKDTREAFAELFDLDAKDIFDDSGKLDAMSLMTQIGDGSRRPMGSSGESALKSMLHVLTHPEQLEENDPIRQTVLGEDPTFTGPARLNGVIDEPEQAPEYLELVKALAEHYGVEARMIGVPTGRLSSQPVDDLRFVDLQDVEWNRKNDAVSYPYTQAGQPGNADVDTGRRNHGATIDFNDGQHVVR